MKPFSNHRTRRNTTFVAILVWVFALASGMANACLLETTGKHLRIAASHALDAHHAIANDAVSGNRVAVDHDDDSDASKESCLKACDDGSNAQIKLPPGVDLTDPGPLAPLIAFAWSEATAMASAPSGFDHLRVPVGPPFRLRYSRLTL